MVSISVALQDLSQFDRESADIEHNHASNAHALVNVVRQIAAGVVTDINQSMSKYAFRFGEPKANLSVAGYMIPTLEIPGAFLNDVGGVDVALPVLKLELSKRRKKLIASALPDYDIRALNFLPVNGHKSDIEDVLVDYAVFFIKKKRTDEIYFDPGASSPT